MKVIVSACLAGIECRYDCKSQTRTDIVEMVKKGEALPLCPEQLGGLSTPRSPAEIQGDKVISINGSDVTEEYKRGAHEALKMAKLIGVKRALLKSKSPMCGHGKVYDGNFSGQTIPGEGILAQLLLKNGFKVESID